MQNNNPCKRIIDGEQPAKVLLDTAKLDIQNLQSVVQGLDGNEKMRLGVVTSESLRTSAVESVIFQGFLLDIYQLATAEEKQLFSNMLQDVDVSRTQAYRAIAVWRKLGPKLVDAPKVMRRFVPEAMKLVCEARVPDPAREEVVGIAKSGRRITIKTVHEVCSKHGVDLGGTAKSSKKPAQPPRSKAAKPKNNKTETKKQGAIFSFVGDFVRLVVKTKADDAGNVPPPVLADVIRDTEKCLNELRRRYAAAKSKSKLTKAG